MKFSVEQIRNEDSQQSANKALISGFIQMVWNEGRYDNLDDFLHEEFADYSIPIKYLQNRSGMKLYLRKLSESVSHSTNMDDYEAYDDLVVCHFTLNWKCGDAWGTLKGRKIFRIKESKILHHWECFD